MGNIEFSYLSNRASLVGNPVYIHTFPLKAVWLIQNKKQTTGLLCVSFEGGDLVEELGGLLLLPQQPNPVVQPSKHEKFI